MGLGEPLRVAEITGWPTPLGNPGVCHRHRAQWLALTVTEVQQSPHLILPRMVTESVAEFFDETHSRSFLTPKVDRAPRKRSKHSKIDARNAPHGDKRAAGDDYCHNGNLKEAQPTQISVRPMKFDELVGARERDRGLRNAVFGCPAGRTPPRKASWLGSRLLSGQITDDLSATSLAENGNIRFAVIVRFDESFAGSFRRTRFLSARKRSFSVGIFRQPWRYGNHRCSVVKGDM